MTRILRDPMNWLYPPLEAYVSGHLEVDGGHSLYWEQSGHPEGKPVVFLHGGPGGGISPKHRRLFDPTRYRVILFDQRGAGRSRPHACLEQNTTWDLIADIERLRTHFGIERWQVFGGSWGSSLALAYAETHPERVSELVLRGIFLGRPHEIRWLYDEGPLRELFPDGWLDFVAPVPVAERGDMLKAYKRLLTSGDDRVRLSAARAWTVWETLLSKIATPPEELLEAQQEEEAISLCEVEIHYFLNGCFFQSENQLLENIARIRHIPTVIIQGRYDLVCPPRSAWDLAEAFPEADLHIIGDAGHSAFEAPITRALVAATDRFARLP